MSLTEAPPVTPRTSAAHAESRIFLRGIDWATYQRLCRAKGDQGVRVAYDEGAFELMSPGPFHERSKSLLALFVALVSMELAIPFAGMGSTRWDDADAAPGLEPDDCYSFEPAKVAAGQQRSNEAADYPNPDLAIEIDLRGGALDRARIYASLGGAEVWRLDGQAVRFEGLLENGGYRPVAESRFLPVRPSDVEHWLLGAAAADQAAWMRQVLDWTRGDLAARPAPGRRHEGGQPG